MESKAEKEKEEGRGCGSEEAEISGNFV